MKHLLKFIMATLAACGIVLLLGSLGSADLGEITITEFLKYILLSFLLLGVSFVGAALTEILPERKS